MLTMTTDFGLEDAYVAALEAAALKVAPELRIVHVSHLVPPGDVAGGAYLLEYACVLFPTGSVHLAVVDPGVGTGRRMLAVSVGNFTVVGPDNGLLDRALRGRDAVAVRLRADPLTAARTFESRDVMAPAAAHIAMGVPLLELGDPAEFETSAPAPEVAGGPPVRTTIAHVDGYGTLVVDLRVAPGARFSELLAGDRRIRFGRTFADVEPGELVAYRGSIGYLEIAVRDGQAAPVLGLEQGAELEVAAID